MSDVRIFTVPILEGIRIVEYKDVVIVRTVRAINILRDITTSFRDTFGGRSGAYQEVMKSMQDEAISELKDEARQLGANAIVGFSIDYENVGSKNKSLIMACAKGTAVVVE